MRELRPPVPAVRLARLRVREAQRVRARHAGRHLDHRDILRLDRPSVDERERLALRRRLAERAPVIIDEADATLDAFPRAAALGYDGVSMKACKGVLRALLSRARIDATGRGFQSAEDLTNLPPWPLLQDLAVVSALGLPHVERNGHHYFRGAGHLSPEERAQLVQRHPDLFTSEAHLRIEDGALQLGSLDRHGFGTDLLPASDASEVAAP